MTQARLGAAALKPQFSRSLASCSSLPEIVVQMPLARRIPLNPNAFMALTHEFEKTAPSAPSRNSYQLQEHLVTHPEDKFMEIPRPISGCAAQAPSPFGLKSLMTPSYCGTLSAYGM
ncbi:MAG: hypothetical protein JW395_2742 [Nitrospira sp.]|nr:hypothetical protein [Nitrospira sp.]